MRLLKCAHACESRLLSAALQASSTGASNWHGLTCDAMAQIAALEASLASSLAMLFKS